MWRCASPRKLLGDWEMLIAGTRDFIDRLRLD